MGHLSACRAWLNAATPRDFLHVIVSMPKKLPANELADRRRLVLKLGDAIAQKFEAVMQADLVPVSEDSATAMASAEEHASSKFHCKLSVLPC